MNDFNTAVDGPLTRPVTVNGKSWVQTFPRWVIEDPAPWLDEIHQSMIKSLTAKIPNTMPALDKARFIWNLEQDRPHTLKP